MSLTFNPNPNAEAKATFDTVKPDVYRMRIQGSENMQALTPFTSSKGNECIKVRLVYVDPTSCLKLDGTPATNPGSLIDSSIIVAPADKQGNLRSLVEACGGTWGQITDLSELEGCELDVKVGTEEYKGELQNKVRAYLAPAM